jgi:hypothetical protein
MLELHEKQEGLNYQGTIIDIETIGDYTPNVYPKYDSREFNKIKCVIFGYINKSGVHVHCAEGIKDISNLEDTVKLLVKGLTNLRPLYALNCHHEMGVLFHHMGIELIFDKELQAKDYESKESALVTMSIDGKCFKDPFQGTAKPGLECKIAWENDQYEMSLRHNRACLLKEQALMLKGRGIPIIPFTFSTKLEERVTPMAFQPWDFKQRQALETKWDVGLSISKIATDLNRSNRAIYMQLQKQSMIDATIPYTIEKNTMSKGV